MTRTSPTANPTNSTSQTFTYSGEPGGTFQCKLDAAAYAACPSSPVTLTEPFRGIAQLLGHADRRARQRRPADHGHVDR